MVSVDEHKRSLEEFLKDVEEKIKSDLIVERQRLIGFALSEASCDLFAIFLHRKNLISPGSNVNHRFFTSGRAALQKFSFDFPRKDELLSLLVKQEGYRSMLCYGRAREREEVERAVKNFYRLREMVGPLAGGDI